jgi:hypothetical protein
MRAASTAIAVTNRRTIDSIDSIATTGAGCRSYYFGLFFIHNQEES